MKLQNRTGIPSYEIHCLILRVSTSSHVLSTASHSISTHTFNHHAQAILVLPSRVDKALIDFSDNSKQMGEVMAGMQGLHHEFQSRGSAKAREKLVAEGKMLPREKVNVPLVTFADGSVVQLGHRLD